jgi:hypothetical protein
MEQIYIACTKVLWQTTSMQLSKQKSAKEKKLAAKICNLGIKNLHQ